MVVGVLVTLASLGGVAASLRSCAVRAAVTVCPCRTHQTLARTPARALAALRARPVLWAVLPGLVLVVAGLGVFFSVLDGVQEKDDLWDLDQPVLDWLVAHRTDGWTSVLAAITFVTGPTVLPIVIVVVRAWSGAWCVVSGGGRRCSPGPWSSPP